MKSAPSLTVEDVTESAADTVGARQPSLYFLEKVVLLVVGKGESRRGAGGEPEGEC